MIVSCHPSLTPDPKGFSKHSDLARFLLVFFLQHTSSRPHRELSFYTTTTSHLLSGHSQMFSIHVCVDRGILVWSLHTIFWQISFHFISFLAITFCVCHVSTCCHIQQHQSFGRLYDPCLSIRCSVFLWDQYPCFVEAIFTIIYFLTLTLGVRTLSDCLSSSHFQGVRFDIFDIFDINFCPKNKLLQ